MSYTLMPYNLKCIIAIGLVLSTQLLLTACGQKGVLYMPDDNVSTDVSTNTSHGSYHDPVDSKEIDNTEADAPVPLSSKEY